MHITDILDTCLTESGRPRLTWYGTSGERVELSGAVTQNWVNKSVNLLCEEFDARENTTIFLDLPVHWRTCLWALAVWRAGACVLLHKVAPPSFDAISDIDVIISDHAARYAGAPRPLVAVALPALARRYDGALPPDTIDAASAVATYGDTLGFVPDTDDAAPAVITGDVTITHGDLVAAAIHRTGVIAPGARILARTASVPTLLAQVLAVLAAGGSAVIAPGLDDAQVPHLVATERIDAEVGL